MQTDAAAVLTDMGFTSSQVTTIQADQQALATAIAANSSDTTTSTSSSTTQSTLQSVSAYLAGLPGISSFGMGGGVAIRGLGPGGGPGYGGGFGSGGGPRGGFMMWRE